MQACTSLCKLAIMIASLKYCIKVVQACTSMRKLANWYSLSCQSYILPEPISLMAKLPLKQSILMLKITLCYAVCFLNHEELYTCTAMWSFLSNARKAHSSLNIWWIMAEAQSQERLLFVTKRITVPIIKKNCLKILMD